MLRRLQPPRKTAEHCRPPTSRIAMAMKKMKVPRHLGICGLVANIAESTRLKTNDVKSVLGCLWSIAYAELKKSREVVIPGLMTLKLKRKPARMVGTKVMFGKWVVTTKPARRAGTKMMFRRALNDPENTLP